MQANQYVYTAQLFTAKLWLMTCGRTIRGSPPKLVDMNPLDEVDLFKISKILLEYLGEAYNRTPKRVILFRTMNTIIMVYIGIFITANFFHVSGGSRVETAQGLITVIHVNTCTYIKSFFDYYVREFFQGLLKYFLYIYFKPGINELLRNKFEKFWNYQQIDDHIITNTIRVYKGTRLVQVSVLGATILLAFIYFFRPILSNSNPFPFEAWVSGIMILDVAALACQYYFFCIVIPIVIGYDAVYFCLCIQIISQTKLLKNRMRYFLNGVEADVSYYIKCHQFLASAFTRMRRLYSSMLLFHYFVTLVTACINLHEGLTSRNSATDMSLKAISILVSFTQFAYYTFPAEMVAFELSDLSNSIYLSEWYTKNVRVQKQLLFMMTKSQHQLYFTGGGLIDINVKTFGSVVRTSFSFYTILRNILNE